jgi:hypothetical protein
MGMVTVKGSVYKLYLRNLSLKEKIKLLLDQLRIPKPDGFINGGKTVAAGKWTPPAAFVINNPVFKAGNVFIKEGDFT